MTQVKYIQTLAKKSVTKRKKQQRNPQPEAHSALRRFWEKHKSLSIGFFLTFATWGWFFAWYWPRMLYFKNGALMTQGKYVWADWSAHLAYAGHFAWRPVGDWFESHPLFFGVDFTYPFAMDALSGILIKWGINEASAFVVPSIVITAWLLVILVLFYHSFLHSGIWSFAAVTLFLAGGSTIFLWYYFPNFVAESAVLPKNYLDLIGWKNIVVSEIIPQRAFLLGMPMMLTIIYFLLRIGKNSRIWQLVLLGVFSALMLFVHVHSYIALVIFGAVLFLSRLQDWKPLVIYGISAAICSFPIFAWMFYGTVEESFFRIQIGWMADSVSLNHNLFWFWLMNWSIFLPLAIIGTHQTKLWKNPVVISGFVIFVICNIVIFQPWDWDNEKILTWSYLFLTVPIIKWFQLLWQQYHMAVVAIVTLILFPLLTLGGFVEIGIHTGHAEEQRLDKNAPPPKDMENFIVRESTIFSRKDFELAAAFRKISNPTDVVLTADRVANWAVALAGRNILLGYRGWMWTYGIDDSKRYNDMQKMFAGGEQSKALLDGYNVNFVVIGYPEITDYHANEDFFRENYSLVLETSEARIYQIGE